MYLYALTHPASIPATSASPNEHRVSDASQTAQMPPHVHTSFTAHTVPYKAADPRMSRFVPVLEAQTSPPPCCCTRTPPPDPTARPYGHGPGATNAGPMSPTTTRRASTRIPLRTCHVDPERHGEGPRSGGNPYVGPETHTDLATVALLRSGGSF